jgi:hypothetical protein
VIEDELRARRDELIEELRMVDAELGLLECPGWGRCHGCMSWCDRCGSVGVTCDSVLCDRHRCVSCGRSVSSIEEIIDGQGHCASCQSREAWDGFLEGWRRLARCFGA